MTSNNFSKTIEEYFHCSCKHCCIMPSIIKNKCCREVEIIEEKLINEKCIIARRASTSYEVLIFSRVPACAIIAVSNQFAEEDETNMPTFLEKSKQIKHCILNKMSIR